MDIVLGVSMTPTTVRMVLVEGENADGITVDHDVFDVTAVDDSATMSAADQVVAAILGTQESAEAGGHHLKSIGVTWSDHSDAAALRDALTAHGIDDVMLVSEGHAAAALAQAVGRAVGYDTTALLFIDRDAATLSVVQTEDGSVVKVLGSSLHSTDAMAVLTDMAAAVGAQETPPEGLFIVGSGVDVSSVKEHLQHLVSMPVNAPEEPELALARGAALASAHAPAFEASTVGLAYSQDPDGPTAGSAYTLAGLDTQIAPAGSGLGSLVGGGADGGAGGGVDDLDPALFNEAAAADAEPKPFLLVGSALTSVFVIGVVALVISLAVSIRPTVDQRPAPAQGAVVPTAPVAKAPAPAPAPEAKPVQEAPPPAPPPETIKAPVPVVQEAPQPQAPPRTVYVEQPQAPAPAPAAPPPPPEAPPPAPVAPVLPAPPPIYQPPGYIPPVVVLPRVPSIFNPPWQPQRPPQQNPWNPPWDPPRQAPKPQWPGSGPGGWNPGSGRGSDDGPSRGNGGGDWNPGRGPSGGPGDGGWNPGGGSGGHNGGGHNGGGGGGPVWPFPFGGGRH